jgi:hypothetical protein
MEASIQWASSMLSHVSQSLGLTSPPPRPPPRLPLDPCSGAEPLLCSFMIKRGQGFFRLDFFPMECEVACSLFEDRLVLAREGLAQAVVPLSSITEVKEFRDSAGVPWLEIDHSEGKRTLLRVPGDDLATMRWSQEMGPRVATARLLAVCEAQPEGDDVAGLIGSLVGRGANTDPPLTQASQRTPLEMVCSWPRGPGKAAAVAVLVASGAMVDRVGISRDAPLHSAVKSGDVEVVRFLLENGADVNVGKDSEGDTPLLCAFRPRGRPRPDPLVCQALVDLLLHHLPDIAETDRNGYTALHLAAAMDLPDCVGPICTLHPTPPIDNVANPLRRTPAHVAAAEGADNAYEALLCLGVVRQDLLDANGDSPMDLFERRRAQR